MTAVLKTDIVEVFYFKSKLHRDKREVMKAIGYSLTENSVLKKNWGVESKHIWVRSKTVVGKSK